MLDVETHAHNNRLAFRTGIPALDKDLPGLFTVGHRYCTSSNTGKSLSYEVVASYLQDMAGREHDGKVFIMAPPELGASTIQRIYNILRIRTTEHNSMRKHGTTASEKKKLLDAKELLNRVSLMKYLDITGLIESISEVCEAHKCGIVVVLGLTSLVTNMQRGIGVVQTAAAVTTGLQKLHSSGNLFMNLLEMDTGWTNTIHENQVGGYDIPQDMSLVTAFRSEAGKSLRMNISPTMERIILEEIDVVIASHDGDGKLHGQHESSVIVEVVKDERLQDDCSLGSWTLWL